MLGARQAMSGQSFPSSRTRLNKEKEKAAETWSPPTALTCYLLTPMVACFVKQALGIDRSVDRQSLLDCSHVHLEQGSWVEDVSIGPRVGVGYAGQWANAPLRFCVAKNEYVSKPWPWAEGRKKGR